MKVPAADGWDRPCCTHAWCLLVLEQAQQMWAHSSLALLVREVDVGVARTALPHGAVSSAEHLLVGAEIAAGLLLACVVDRVLVAGQVVGPRVDQVPGLWSWWAGSVGPRAARRLFPAGRRLATGQPASAAVRAKHQPPASPVSRECTFLPPSVASNCAAPPRFIFLQIQPVYTKRAQ